MIRGAVTHSTEADGIIGFSGLGVVSGADLNGVIAFGPIFHCSVRRADYFVFVGFFLLRDTHIVRHVIGVALANMEESG
jgi:hypothetical protein